MTEVRRLQDSQVSDLENILTGHPIFEEAKANRAKERTATRQALADKLTAAASRAESDWKQHSAAMDQAMERVKAAQQALQDRQAEFNDAFRARSNASRTFTALRDETEALLRDLAAEEIADFLREMRKEQYRTAKAKLRFHPLSSAGERSVITGKRLPRKDAAVDPIGDRLAAIKRAIEKAEAMQYEPDQSSVPEKLAALRAGLPSFEALAPGDGGADAAAG